MDLAPSGIGEPDPQCSIHAIDAPPTTLPNSAMPYAGPVEFAHARPIRARNPRLYRLAHWPIWIWVFFLAPGPLTFSLFSRGFHWINWSWLAVVLIGTGIAGLRGP